MVDKSPSKEDLATTLPLQLKDKPRYGTSSMGDD